MKYVFVSPHADDSEFGCGGLIAKLTSEGHRCVIALMTQGDVPMQHSGQTAKAEQRFQEQLRAAMMLGAEVFPVQAGTTGHLVADMQAVARFDAMLNFLGDVEAVFAPAPSFNQDHVATWQIVLASMRPGRPVTKKTKLYMYEIPHDCGNVHGLLGGVNGKTYVGLTDDHLEKKVAALNLHESQTGRPGSLTSGEAVMALATVRGIECQEKYAEVFYLVRGVGL